jgi:hypothetical protein
LLLADACRGWDRLCGVIGQESVRRRFVEGKMASMTEAEWLACTDPKPMLDFLKGRTSDRKLRLFVCGCVRRFWHDLPDERLRTAIESSEQHVDGRISDRDFGKAVSEAHRVRRKRNELAQAAYDAARYVPGDVQTWSVITHIPYAVARMAVPNVPPVAITQLEGDKCVTRNLPVTPAHIAFNAVRDAEYAAQANLLRDIIGNPFRPVALDSAWLTPAVISLAQTIYDERAFDRMPELADALEKAGCTSKEVLEHCRGGGPHVRGCWVVDLLLGKQ